LVSLGALVATGQAAGAAPPAEAADQTTAEQIVEKSREAYAALSSYSDSGTVVSEMAGVTNTLSFKTRLQRPNQYRISWKLNTPLKVMPGSEGITWSDGTGDYVLSSGSSQEKTPKRMVDMKSALSAAAGFSWSTSLAVPGAFFHGDFRDAFVALVLSGHYPLTREKDAKLGNIDCYVVSSVIDLSKAPETGKSGTASTRLWIGQHDFLIHQSRTKLVNEVAPDKPPTEQEIDAASRKSLEMQNKPATPEAVAAMRPQMRAIMKQTQATIRSSFESGVVTTRILDKIVVNERLAPAAFTR
jgi:hypothetical protein